MKFDPRSKSGKPSIAIMIGVKPSKKDDKKKYGGGPDMKKGWENINHRTIPFSFDNRSQRDTVKPIDMSEHIQGDPTRPFGRSMEPGEPLIDTKSGKNVDTNNPRTLMPRHPAQYSIEEGRHYAQEGGEGEGEVDPESLQESNPELFEMDDPRWKDREPAPKGYERGRDGRLRRVSSDEGRRPWSADDVSNLLARAKGNDSIAMSMDNPMSAAWGLLRG